MGKFVLTPCRLCGKNAVVERWASGGTKHMIKCNNSDCPVPPEGYPTGRDLEGLKEEWNIKQLK